ncbi:hypothetical protein [Actinomadura rugatobispora]|uniref:Shikimate dehydrogenase n=1 Tax=Actinomadura rugatobispora TaxID=1994 RepID=A0ABW1A3N9_9ACTN
MSVLSGSGDGAWTLRAAVRRCQAEAGAGAGAKAAVIAGVGTTAPGALKGRLLLDALAAAGVTPARAVPFDDPRALLADAGWDLALVLSPWKKDAAALLAAGTGVLTGSAAATGVVDTVVRDGGRLVGVNTNCWSAQAAMETLMGGRAPAAVLVLGSGGSSGSVALAVRRAWPDARLAGSARNAAALAAWADRFGADAVAPGDLEDACRDAPPSLIVNATTWGETPESEGREFAFPFNALAAPGNAYFDLNNRVSSLQTRALQAGMNVMSGTFMQRVTNACRAALLTAEGTR